MPMPAENMHNEASKALQVGLDAADGPVKRDERADVTKWRNRINATLKFDEASRKTFVKCRRYARGDSGFLVDANIIGTNIDILEAFIYAKDPDVDISPARGVEAPDKEAMLETAIMMATRDPRLPMLQQQAQEQAIEQSLQFAQAPPESTLSPEGVEIPPPAPPDPIQAPQMALEALVQEYLAQIKASYDRTTRENKAYAETCEVVVSRFWKDGRLKDRGRPFVRSALTTGLGVLKASWQERTAVSPETKSAINDLVEQLDRAKELRYSIADEVAGDEQDAKIAELERQIQAIRAKTEMPADKGFFIDSVTPENFIVAPGFRIADHVDAPWNAERIPMSMDRICQMGNLTPEERARVTKYRARTPTMPTGESANLQVWDVIDPSEASEFVKGAPIGVQPMNGETGPSQGGDDDGDAEGISCFGMVYEIWDRASNSVMWMVEGLDRWLRAAWNPPATTRFYPYFLFCTSEVDGQRYPQSPVERSWKLIDEYNRIGSAEAKHRRRILPKTGFNAGNLQKGSAEKLEKADVGEMVALELTDPNADIRAVLMPIAYPAIDMALYDRSRINNEIERIWGVQEALGGSITTDKTATEAEIQQQGFQARTGSRRDSIEASLGHLALYTVEIARAKLVYDAVVKIAGPNAFWPEYEGAEDVTRQMAVDIRAGSTGKPNTRADREAWGTILPQLEKAIGTYAQLTGSNPMDVAESIKKLAAITAQRAGERLDIDALFPAPGTGPMLPPPGPGGAPAQPPGGQGGAPSPQPPTPEPEIPA